jgi:bifunctional non-homologous end joining protein LigD
VREQQLGTVVNPEAKLIKAIKKPKAIWVERISTRKLNAATSSKGLLRASLFKGPL